MPSPYPARMIADLHNQRLSIMNTSICSCRFSYSMTYPSLVILLDPEQSDLFDV